MTSGELKGFKNIFHFFTPVKEIPVPSLINPLPSIRTHKNNALSTVPCHHTDKDKSKENELKNALRMVGREHELEWLKSVMQKVYKQGLNELVLIKGVLGSGKSLFIRKAIYEFFMNQEKEVSNYLYGINQNPLVFVSFQKPDSYNVVFNGWENIFKMIYLRIVAEMEKQSKPRKIIKMKVGEQTIKFLVDDIGEILFQSDCYMNIKYLDEIFHPENSSNSYNEELKHYYDKDQSDDHLETKAKISKNTTQFFVTIKTDLSNSMFSKHFSVVNPEHEKLLPMPFEPNPRDIFFETRKFESKTEKAIITFFISLLKKYQEICVHHYNPELPLIFAIEDCHLIDNISCEFIKEIATELDFTHILIICSYQMQMSMVVSNPLEKFNSKHDLMTIPNCIEMNPFFYYDEIFPLIRDFLKQKYNQNIEKIEKRLLSTIISKSFKGIPLFILELIDRFLKDETYAKIKGKELISTPALNELEKTNDWSEFPIPFLYEAVISSIIDSLNPKEIIILKIASVIGVLFDLNKLNEFNPFNNVTFDELHSIILSFEKRGMLEILWDYDPRFTVCKFSIPFLRDILYQRMLIEQRNEIHLNVARSLQNNKFSYMNPENELRLLRMHLRQNEKTIGTYMEEDEELVQLDRKIETNQGLSFSNNKMYLVKAICDRINNHDFDDNSHILKSGELFKKMDSSKIWECKFCMITIDKFIYYNCENDHLQHKDPQGKFWLKDISDVAVLANHDFGKKKNLFAISVTKWFDNDSEGSAKTFLFSADLKEDLMIWITTFNFLCLNAFYGRFTKMFGIINLPLVKKDTMERKYKKKFTVPDNQISNNQTKKIALFCGSFNRKSIYNKSLRAIGMTAERLKGKDRLLSTFKGNLIMNFEVVST